MTECGFQPTALVHVPKYIVLKMPLADCKFLDLPKIEDRRGSLTFLQSEHPLPFEIARVYYLYDVPGGAERGAHAHKKLHQFIVAISGSFDVILDDGRQSNRFHLNRPYFGLYVCPMMWRVLDNFSSGSVCLVLASDKYDEADYIRDRDDFLTLAA
jgi:hypothetical protein